MISSNVKVWVMVNNFPYKGVVLERADFTTPLWWVEYENGDDTEVRVFAQDDLEYWNALHHECVCGSLTVNHPGHAEYCEYDKHLQSW